MHRYDEHPSAGPTIKIWSAIFLAMCRRRGGKGRRDGVDGRRGKGGGGGELNYHTQSGFETHNFKEAKPVKSVD